MERAQRVRWVAAAAVVAAVMLPWGCSRAIEEEEPPVLIEHRIEPCRKWCEPMLSAECGRAADDRPFPTVDACVETCAAAEPGGWEWARQADGTDACAEEWFVVADCMDALTCEEQRFFFREKTPGLEDYPCKEELDARRHCFNSTPSLEKVEDDQ